MFPSQLPSTTSPEAIIDNDRQQKRLSKQEYIPPANSSTTSTPQPTETTMLLSVAPCPLNKKEECPSTIIEMRKPYDDLSAAFVAFLPDLLKSIFPHLSFEDMMNFVKTKKKILESAQNVLIGANLWNFYFMKELPEELEKYPHSYFFLGNNLLYYVADGISEEVPIDQVEDFNKKLLEINIENITQGKLCLTMENVQELITAHSGHSPKGKNTKLFSELWELLSEFNKFNTAKKVKDKKEFEIRDSFNLCCLLLSTAINAGGIPLLFFIQPESAWMRYFGEAGISLFSAGNAARQHKNFYIRMLMSLPGYILTCYFAEYIHRAISEPLYGFPGSPGEAYGYTFLFVFLFSALYELLLKGLLEEYYFLKNPEQPTYTMLISDFGTPKEEFTRKEYINRLKFFPHYESSAEILISTGSENEAQDNPNISIDIPNLRVVESSKSSSSSDDYSRYRIN